MWDYQIGAYIANILKLMNDPQSPKTAVENKATQPGAATMYRLEDGTLVSYSLADEELRVEFTVRGGRAEIKVSCRKCRQCGKHLFPNTGKFCTHCGAVKEGGGKTTLDREPFI